MAVCIYLDLFSVKGPVLEVYRVLADGGGSLHPGWSGLQRHQEGRKRGGLERLCKRHGQ